MARPRRLKDPRPAASLADFTALMTATLDVTLPCGDGTAEEWTSEDPRLLARAAELCQACVLIGPCRSYSLASGERHGTWGGLTPADRKRIRRKKAA